LKTPRNGRASHPLSASSLAEVSARLNEAEETLRAIQSGEADVVVSSGSKGVQVLEQEGAERTYRLLIESMNEGALTMTQGGMILYCNSCFAGMVKSPLEKVIGVSLGRYLGQEDQEALRLALMRTNKAGTKLQVVLNADDYSKIAVQISIRPTVRIAGPRTIGIVVTDLTETRRTEDLLRALTHGVVRAQEEERGRVAIELHDGAVQLLCALMYSSQAFLAKLSPADGIARVEAEKIRDIASKAADEVDRVSRNLRPTALDQLGLVPALRHASREFSARSGVPVKVASTKLSHRLLPDSELTLYRILQEALTNIEKHASARRVRVRLGQVGGFAQMLINDDGIGFDPEKRRARKGARGGLGLLGMRERALYAGGEMTMKSSPGSGTEIEITVPMPETPRDS